MGKESKRRESAVRGGEGCGKQLCVGGCTSSLKKVKQLGREVSREQGYGRMGSGDCVRRGLGKVR